MKAKKNKQAVAFGEVLKELRKEAELSQDALAEKADLERTFISFRKALKGLLPRERNLLTAK